MLTVTLTLTLGEHESTLAPFTFPQSSCFSWNFQGPGNSRQNKDFTPRNSEKLCCTPLRNFKTSKQPRSLKIPHDFFLIIPKFHIVFNWTLKIPFRLIISSILLEIPYPQPPSPPPCLFCSGITYCPLRIIGGGFFGLNGQNLLHVTKVICLEYHS